MKRVDKVISNWHVLVDNFSTSGREFYELVEEAVRARQVPDVEFSRHDFNEGGFATSKRQYLRIERKFVAFDVCASPYGRGYFFSWWLTRVGPKHPVLYLIGFLFLVSILGNILLMIQPGMIGLIAWFIALPIAVLGLGYLVQQRVIGPEEHILMVPMVGWLYEKMFNPITYYSLDTAHMFQDAIRQSVNEVIDGLLTTQGLQALREDQKAPSLRELAQPVES